VAKSASLRIPPLCRFFLLFIVFFATDNLTLAIPVLAQTIAQAEVAKSQPAGSLPQSAPKRKPTQAAGQSRLSARGGASGGTRSQLALRCPFGPSLDTWRVTPNSAAHSIYDSRIAELEKQMWVLINRDRSNPDSFLETGGRAQPLKWNESLAEVARAHSRNMLMQQFFSHDDPQGRSYEMRLDRAGIAWWAAGENIAIGDTVLQTQTGLMNEAHSQPNHRYNILNAFYTDVGIGIVKGPDGSLYVTQDFVQAPASHSAAATAP